MKSFQKALVLCFVLMGIGILAGWSATSDGQGVATLEEISGYKHWTQVNPEPVLLPKTTAAACRMANTPDNVHRDQNQEKYLVVYVNQIGERAMLQEQRPKFPVGSVIVKEKLPAKDSPSPELLTVMIKRAAGFNPENGDWEFLVVDGSGTKVQGRGKLGNCQACHHYQAETDYIFRSYLPSEIRQKLAEKRK